MSLPKKRRSLALTTVVCIVAVGAPTLAAAQPWNPPLTSTAIQAEAHNESRSRPTPPPWPTATSWPTSPGRPTSPPRPTPPGSNQEVPDSPVRARVLQSIGEGCSDPQYQRAGIVDNRKLTVGVDRFYAALGGELPYNIPKSTCQMTITVDSPLNWTFGIKSIRIKGWSNLSERGSGNMIWKGGFRPDQYGNVTRPLTIGGPANFPFKDHLDIPMDAVSWRACGSSAPVYLASELGVFVLSNTPVLNALTTSSNWEGDWAEFELIWKKC